MKELPQISESEWEIMRLLWEKAPRSAQNIIENLKDRSTWMPKTVKSLISRLVKKGAIAFDQDSNRAYMYYPLYKKEQFVKKENRSFLDKVYGGELNALFAAFINDTDIDEKQLAEYKTILDKALKKRKAENK